MKRRREWSAEQDRQILAMYDSGVSFNQIGKRVGAPASTVSDRYYALTGRSPQPAAKAQEVLNRRMEAPHRTLVGALMGDPPIGFSALDQRNRT